MNFAPNFLTGAKITDARCKANEHFVVVETAPNGDMLVVKEKVIQSWFSNESVFVGAYWYQYQSKNLVLIGFQKSTMQAAMNNGQFFVDGETRNYLSWLHAGVVE